MTTKHPMEQLIDAVTEAVPSVRANVDKPSQPEGHWIVDMENAGHEVVVEWRQKRGFGVSSSIVEAGYGEGPEEVYGSLTEAADRVIQLFKKRRRTRPPKAVLLRQLRELTNLTQEQLAKRLGVRQAAVSRLERRREMNLGTLRRFIEAMGGKLEVTARFPDQSIRIAQFEEDEAG